MFERTVLAFLISISISTADARNFIPDPDPAVNEWYKKAIEPDTRSPVSCCGVADAYWADSYEVVDGHYIAIITDDRDIPGRVNLDGKRIPVPDNKLPNPAKQQPNPTGHGVIFVSPSGDFGDADEYVVFCYFPPGGV